MMVGIIICEISTIIYNINIINIKFYLLEISYLYRYRKIPYIQTLSWSCIPICKFTIEQNDKNAIVVRLLFRLIRSFQEYSAWDFRRQCLSKLEFTSD